MPALIGRKRRENERLKARKAERIVRPFRQGIAPGSQKIIRYLQLKSRHMSAYCPEGRNNCLTASFRTRNELPPVRAVYPRHLLPKAVPVFHGPPSFYPRRVHAPMIREQAIVVVFT